ncbi:MAG: response regulator [Pseudomonadota bacterium]
MKPILVVDDSATILSSMKDMLMKAGQKVETANSAEAALAFVRGQPPLTMLITDYHMPGRNGVELIAEIRKMAAYRFIPILMLTTESQQDKRNEAKAAGATGWLVKPVGADKLTAIVKKLVPGG